MFKNALLDDKELIAKLHGINSKFGEFIVKASGETWAEPLIDQKTKVFFTIVIDVVNQGISEPSPFMSHIDMAVKQGATKEELEELLKFCCLYAGFNKCVPAFVRLEEYFTK